MSKPIVVIVCMARSSESREPQQRPHPWHRCAGGGAVHSINNGHSPLFDHLIGAGEQRGNGEAERLGCLEVDGEVELGRLDDRQIGWLLALENATDIDPSL